MGKVLNEMFDWSEVWAPLIPLIVWLFVKPKHKWVKPVIIYLFLAFIFCSALDVIWKQNHLGLNKWFDQNFQWWPKDQGYMKNTIFYNFISISRLLLFAWFFNCFGGVFVKLNKYIPFLFILFTITNFIFFEKIEDFSSRLITLEAAILLFYSILYFFRVLKDDSPDDEAASKEVFRVVMGLSIYVALNFFIFLLYKQLTTSFTELAKQIWPIHNLSNIIFCLLIALAFRKK
jgi:hypothetical protein